MSNLLATLQSLAEQGGFVIPLLFGLSIILWALIIERFSFIYLYYPKLEKDLLQHWQQRQDTHSWYAQSIRDMHVSATTASLEKYQSTIRNLIALCPLFGLLGTVTGMIAVFDTIALTGNSDAKAMAAGIYRATLPTMAGLLLALSAMYFSHNLLRKTKALSGALQQRLNSFGGHHAP